jgi:hypothetical protein
MSWITPIALIVIVTFAGAFGLCEWLVRRNAGRSRGRDDTSAMG